MSEVEAPVTENIKDEYNAAAKEWEGCQINFYFEVSLVGSGVRIKKTA